MYLPQQTIWINLYDNQKLSSIIPNILGRIIPYSHSPTRVLNTAQWGINVSKGVNKSRKSRSDNGRSWLWNQRNCFVENEIRKPRISGFPISMIQVKSVNGWYLGVSEFGVFGPQIGNANREHYDKTVDLIRFRGTLFANRPIQFTTGLGIRRHFSCLHRWISMVPSAHRVNINGLTWQNTPCKQFGNSVKNTYLRPIPPPSRLGYCKLLIPKIRKDPQPQKSPYPKNMPNLYPTQPHRNSPFPPPQAKRRSPG